MPELLLASTGHVEAHEPDPHGRQRRWCVETLQTMVERYYPQGRRLFLKIDAQGYEKQILRAPDRASVVGLRIELSLVRSYEGAPLAAEMLAYLAGLGYRLCGIDEAWSNRVTQEVYELDAVLCRTDRVAQELP